MKEIALAIIIGLAGFAGLQTWRIALLKQEHLAAEVERGKATIRQLDAAQLQTAEWQGKANDAQTKLDEFARREAATRGRLTSELARLRNDLDAAAENRDMSQSACTAHVARIRLVEELFVRCASRYSAVAGDAQQWKGYARSLVDSWPATTSK